MRLNLTLFLGVLAALAIVWGTAPAAKAHPPAARRREAYVDVGVATLWVQPKTNRPIDKPAVSDPSNVRLWQESMSLRQKRWLVGKLETQALYGQKVVILKHSSNWVKVAVKGQPTPRNKCGYPGWMPTRQLTYNAWFSRYHRRAFVQVERPIAWLYDTAKLGSRSIEVSYATRLPLLPKRHGAIEVVTPHGDKWLKASVASVYRSESAISHPTGRQSVESAKKFLGLPYLWAGTSGFGFDCSGFTYTVFRAHGITIPRDTVTRAQLENPALAGGKAVQCYAALREGDLLYFAHVGGAGHIYHVGMYVGNGRMIHAPNPSRSVEIIGIESSGWIKEYAGAIRYY